VRPDAELRHVRTLEREAETLRYPVLC
jgi:hypothetical protein